MLEDTLHPGSLDNRGKFHDWTMAAAMVEGRKTHAECKPELTLDPAQSAALIAANRPSLNRSLSNVPGPLGRQLFSLPQPEVLEGWPV
ncbi:UNVERIFIED_CONTAM: hypothetical protein K2H54_006683 [Gekko kuhli]